MYCEFWWIIILLYFLLFHHIELLCKDKDRLDSDQLSLKLSGQTCAIFLERAANKDSDNEASHRPPWPYPPPWLPFSWMKDPRTTFFNFRCPRQFFFCRVKVPVIRLPIKWALKEGRKLFWEKLVKGSDLVNFLQKKRDVEIGPTWEHLC